MAAVAPAAAAKFTVLCGMVLSTTLVSVQGEARLSCPRQDWFLYGAHCYKVHSIRLSWNGALEVCRTDGADLARIEDKFTNKYLGDLASYIYNVKDYWIGMNRRGLNESSPTESRWSDDTVTSITHGFWDVLNPDLQAGKCVYVVETDRQYRWKLGTCEWKGHFICSLPACAEGSFQCSSGECVQSSRVCDDYSDCSDGSDEIECAPYRMYIKGSSGIIESPVVGGTYPINSDYQWTIEGPVGSNIKLKVLHLDIQEDELMIMGGGRTTSTSTRLARLSGADPPSAEIFSYNNFMIIRFISDASVQGTGFNLSWTAVESSIPHAGKVLLASDSWAPFSAPFRSASYLCSQETLWIIKSVYARKIITLQRDYMDLAPGDVIDIRDGHDASAPHLAQYRGTTGPRYVLSTGPFLYILLKTGKNTNVQNQGFAFKYLSGCQVDLTERTGEIFSPGYGIANYADYVICTYTIRSSVRTTLRFDSLYGIEYEEDKLKVFLGNNENGKAQHSEADGGYMGADPPKPVVANDGFIFVVFQTNAVDNDIGWKAVFSNSCTQPVFTPETIRTPAGDPYDYGDTFNVSCPPGYVFDSLEFYTKQADGSMKSKDVVSMTCGLGGVWNVLDYPECVRRYCGQPPEIADGYVKTDGVVYGSKATYACRLSHTLVGAVEITCQEDGTWGSPPVCEVVYCPSINTSIDGGSGQLVEGNSTEAGSTYQFQCNSGYRLSGSPIVHCNSSGQWSYAVPTCSKIKCLVPSLLNGDVIVPGPKTDLVEFGEVLTVQCKSSGYELKGSPTITCQADHTFTSLPECKDKDECSNKPCPANSECTNTEGSYYCSCLPGFENSTNQCVDIEECKVDNGGCSGTCENTIGSYVCSCPPGYSLFTHSGTMGFNVPQNETGVRFGETYYINHTCVPNQCNEEITNITNGYVPENRTQYNYKDTVSFGCFNGYILKGEVTLHCQADGNWSAEQPTCEVAMCPPDELPQNLLNTPKSIVPSGKVMPGETVTITCNLSGVTEYTKTRTCRFDPGEQVYRLQGDSYECGVIDCGPPILPPGGRADPPPVTTTYGSQFVFSCGYLYDLVGLNNMGSHNVTCAADYSWTFLDLICIKRQCPHPGVPAGGSVTLQGGRFDYYDNATFHCDRNGFKPEIESLRCGVNEDGTGLSWGKPTPACIDVDPPAFLGCPTSPVKVTRFSSAGFTVPVPTDNSGSVSEVIVTPHHFQPTMVITEDMTVNYTAVDHAGLTAECIVDIVALEFTPPILQCPGETIETLSKVQGGSTLFYPSSANVTYNSSDATLTFEPAGPLNFSYDDVGKHYVITVTATDQAGNNASCQYQVSVQGALCEPNTLKSTNTDSASCSDLGNGGQLCTLRCQDGFYFYDDIEYLNPTCQPGQAWVPSYIPSCTKSAPVEFNMKAELQYGASSAAPLTEVCQGSYSVSMLDLLRTSDFKTDICGLVTTITDVTYNEGSLVSTYNSTSQQIKFEFSFQLSPPFTPQEEESQYIQCASLISFQLRDIQNSGILAAEWRTLSGSSSCPFVSVQGSDPVTSNYQSCASDYRQRETNDGTVCLPCPPGRSKNPTSGECELCPVGQYWVEDLPPRYGRCIDCSRGRLTDAEGSIGEDSCFDLCDGNFVSETGLPPCSECTGNSFAVNGTYCHPCPSGTLALRRENPLVAACEKKNCTYERNPGKLNTGDPIQHYNGITLQMCKDLCDQWEILPGHFSECVGFNYETSNGECFLFDKKLVVTSSGSLEYYDRLCEPRNLEDCFCARKCPAGKYSSTGHEPDCLPCPAGFINNDEGATSCQECPNGQTSLIEYGTSCFDASYLCTSCRNSVACTVPFHEAVCTCLPGWTGRYCDTVLNSCDSSPCYNNGNCMDFGQGFVCQCPSGFRGDRCEENIDDCTPQACGGHGTCIDGVNSFTCDCVDYYGGSRCENQLLTGCDLIPCGNNSDCVHVHDYNRDCECHPGYMGPRCEIEINECESEPCQNGGSCVDLLNRFECLCHSGFTGDLCQHPNKSCHSNPCGPVMHCINDLLTGLPKCICEHGYTQGKICQYSFSIKASATGSVLLVKTSTASAQCRELCDIRGDECEAFLHDPTSNTCTLYSTAGSVVSGGTSSFSIKTCSYPREDYFYTEWFNTVDAARNGTDHESFDVIQELGMTVCENTEPVGVECRQVSSKAAIPAYATCDQSGLVCSPSAGACPDMEIRFRCARSRVFEGKKCSVRDICSEGHKCQDGICITDPRDVKGYRCDCRPGSTGDLCQLATDKCANQPCLNNGRCIDVSVNFTCECPKGFKGERCELNSNECDANTCDSVGTQACVDGLDEYTCACRDGYTGPNCSINFDDCWSNPCLHGASCVDLVDGYRCECLDGFAGSRCERVVDGCDSNPCFFDGNCVTHLNEFTCRCPEGTFGNRCENKPSVSQCQFNNPCVNTDLCRLIGTKAVCNCNAGTTGQGCEVDIDNSCGSIKCQNGATCRETATGHECVCPPGYSGALCDVDIDECATKSCPMAATCVDGINEAFCRCQLGKALPFCFSDIDEDYDMCFSSSLATTGAALPFTLQVSQLQGFTIMMWVRFEQSGGTGTFFTLYTTSSRSLASQRTEAIRLNESGMYVNLAPFGKRTLSFRYFPINDGLWHLVVIFWNSATGNLDLTVDYLRQDSASSFGTLQRLTANLWIVLGGQRDAPPSSASFQGCLSDVEILSYGLDFASDLPNLQKGHSRYTGDILRWAEFEDYGNTWFVRPSEAKLVNCLAFPSEPLCINQNKVKPTVPEVTFCPEDITVPTIYNDAYATWTEPTFSSGVVSVDFSQPSGSLFRRGFTEVVYIARDEEGNTAVCTFSVFVGDAICPVPDPPRGGGARSCQNRTDAFNYCSVSCPVSSQSLVEDVPEYYTCGPSGSWDTLQDQDGIFPTCGRIVGPARADVNIYLPYNINTGVCSTITQSIVTKGREELANLFQDWGGQLCRSADCSDITPIVNCSDLSSTTVNITLTDVSAVLQNGNEKRTVEEVWLIAVLDDKHFTFDTIIPRASLLEQQFTVEVIYFCEEGQVVRDTLCVECGPGTFYNSSTKECDNCPVGQYMAGYAALSCTPCPNGKTTRAMGSTGSDECEENCSAGSYFKDNGCVECPVAFYQDQPGQFECTPCPRGLLTLTIGSTSVNSCADPCDSGFELLVNGTCVPCSHGTYRQSGLNQTCLPCPSAYTTPSVGSTSAGNCTVLRCPVGSRANENQTACELCPVGTYQPLVNQRDCLPCSINFTTANRGSSNASECKQFCPSGYEVEAGRCVACPIATYKDNSKDPLSLCLPCDFGYLTPSDTSISESNCSIRNCSAGFFIQRDPLGVETCVPCPVDQYNPLPYQYTCLPCPPGNGTRKSGADRESMCEAVCDSGEEVVNGVCTPCPQGYYKNNSDDRFAQCSLCPTEFITATTGAVSSDLCNIRNCSAGYYREVSNNMCMKCPMNTYQPDKWQTSCVDCPPEHLTRSTGASSKDQCLLSCSPGRQDQNDTCADCPVGFYKNTTGVAGCVACPAGFHTADTGSTDEANCSVVACDPGTYLDSAQNICEPCPYGQYQPSKWQDSCVPCPAGKTTFMEGASSTTQCFRDCAEGRELDLATDECEACKRGYYRDKSSPNQTACVLCPSSFITPGIGTDSASDCRIANCTVPGYYLNTGANKCEECPVGSYNSRWWAESCTPCVSGFTTKTTGLATEDSCYRDCPSGQQVNEITNLCSVCERGKFRDKDQTWTCQPCPTPFTTPAAEATSVSNCTVPTCSQGSYYSDKQSVCAPCPPGTYQPESGMRRCLDCPDHGSTLTEGRVSSSDCISLCDPQLRLNNCSADAQCSVSSDGDLQCTCKSFFQGDGYSCTHVCDLQEPYCRNGGTCYKNRGNPCVCGKYYSGPQCQRRADPSKTPNDTEIIVIVCILVGALLCVIILIIIAIVRRRQRQIIKDKDSDSTSNNQSGTPSGIIPRFNTKAYMLEDPAYYNAKQSNRAVSSLYYDNATYTYSEETT